jgi:hypothetical protein
MLIDNDVVYKVSEELGYDLTEEQIQTVVNAYPSYQEKHPNDYYDEIIGMIIEDIRRS